MNISAHNCICKIGTTIFKVTAWSLNTTPVSHASYGRTPNDLGSVEVELKIDIKALQKMAVAASKAGVSFQQAADNLKLLFVPKCKREWWKRGEAPPNFTCDRDAPEWWQRGDEPPPFGCAA